MSIILYKEKFITTYYITYKSDSYLLKIYINALIILGEVINYLEYGKDVYLNIKKRGI